MLYLFSADVLRGKCGVVYGPELCPS